MMAMLPLDPLCQVQQDSCPVYWWIVPTHTRIPGIYAAKSLWDHLARLLLPPAAVYRWFQCLKR